MLFLLIPPSRWRPSRWRWLMRFVWRLKAGGMTMVSIQAFDDPAVFAFENEIYIDAKPANYDFAGDRPRLTGAEVEAMYAPNEG